MCKNISPEEKHKYNQDWYKQNREKKKLRTKLYYQANKENIKKAAKNRREYLKLLDENLKALKTLRFIP